MGDGRPDAAALHDALPGESPLVQLVPGPPPARRLPAHVADLAKPLERLPVDRGTADKPFV